jgi:hypothetical protein
MKIKLTLIAQILCVFILISCAGFPSENQDLAKNNTVTYNKDFKECKEDYPETSSGTHIRQWIGCMKLKGWR